MNRWEFLIKNAYNRKSSDVMSTKCNKVHCLKDNYIGSMTEFLKKLTNTFSKRLKTDEIGIISVCWNDVRIKIFYVVIHIYIYNCFSLAIFTIAIFDVYVERMILWNMDGNLFWIHQINPHQAATISAIQILITIQISYDTLHTHFMRRSGSKSYLLRYFNS